MPGSVWIEVGIDLESLALDLESLTRDRLLEFILEIDSNVAELDFTESLVNALTKVIEEERAT